MNKETFIKAQIEIFTLYENDIIVTSGIGLPDVPWDDEEEGNQG